jgi:hypothetical protein
MAKIIIDYPTIHKSHQKVTKMNLMGYDKISDEIFKYQPVLLSTFLAMQKEISDPNKLGNLFLIMMAIWLSIRRQDKIIKTAITDDLFEAFSDENITFVKQLQNLSRKDLSKLLDSQLHYYNQKYLFAFIIDEIFNDKDNKYCFDLHMIGKVILYLKALIDCIDFILNENTNN